jgi:hypothetical protein
MGSFFSSQVFIGYIVDRRKLNFRIYNMSYGFENIIFFVRLSV